MKVYFLGTKTKKLFTYDKFDVEQERLNKYFFSLINISVLKRYRFFALTFIKNYKNKMNNHSPSYR